MLWERARNGSFPVERRNNVKSKKSKQSIEDPDEKKKTYIALGYTITDMDGNMIHEHVEPSEKLEQAEKEIQDLKEKLEEASKYAENADKKIEDLEKKNAEAEKEIQDLKAQIASAGATEQAATPAPETKKTTKASSKAEK